MSILCGLAVVETLSLGERTFCLAVTVVVIVFLLSHNRHRIIWPRADFNIIGVPIDRAAATGMHPPSTALAA